MIPFEYEKHYQEVERLTQVLRSGGGFVVTINPQALAEASQRVIYDLRVEADHLRRRNEELYNEIRELKVNDARS